MSERKERDGDPLAGAVLADDLVQLYRDELDVPLGVLSPAQSPQSARPYVSPCRDTLA